MKQLSMIAAIALIGLAFLSGCSKKSSSSPAYSMKATIGTTNMNTTACISTTLGTVLSVSGSTITSGVGGPPIMAIVLSNWSGAAGTFTLGDATADNWGQFTQSSSGISVFTTSGTITISSVSTTTISGTFSGTLSTGAAITGGTFSAQRF